MKRIILLAIIFQCTFSIFAQLDKVAPMSSVVHNSAKIENMNLLISTKDFTNIFFSPLLDSFATTVQLVHANTPFPPIWYQIGTHSLSFSGKVYTDFYLDPEIQSKTGHLSFNYTILPDSIEKPSVTGYVVLDTLTFLPIDSITDKTFTFDSVYAAVDNHEYLLYIRDYLLQTA